MRFLRFRNDLATALRDRVTACRIALHRRPRTWAAASLLVLVFALSGTGGLALVSM